MRHEVSGRREAGQNEGNRSREQADREQDASDQFDQPSRPRQRADLNVRETRNGWKTENFAGAVLKQFEASEDSQNAENTESTEGEDALRILSSLIAQSFNLLLKFGPLLSVAVPGIFVKREDVGS